MSPAEHFVHATVSSLYRRPSYFLIPLAVNDFANDVKANVIPQWNFVTPNLVNDVRLQTQCLLSPMIEPIHRDMTLRLTLLATGSTSGLSRC